jgi:hypothetical protein
MPNTCETKYRISVKARDFTGNERVRWLGYASGVPWLFLHESYATDFNRILDIDEIMCWDEKPMDVQIIPETSTFYKIETTVTKTQL